MQYGIYYMMTTASILFMKITHNVYYRHTFFYSFTKKKNFSEMCNNSSVTILIEFCNMSYDMF